MKTLEKNKRGCPKGKFEESKAGLYALIKSCKPVCDKTDKELSESTGKSVASIRLYLKALILENKTYHQVYRKNKYKSWVIIRYIRLVEEKRSGWGKPLYPIKYSKLEDNISTELKENKMKSELCALFDKIEAEEDAKIKRFEEFEKLVLSDETVGYHYRMLDAGKRNKWFKAYELGWRWEK